MVKLGFFGDSRFKVSRVTEFACCNWFCDGVY